MRYQPRAGILCMCYGFSCVSIFYIIIFLGCFVFLASAYLFLYYVVSLASFGADPALSSNKASHLQFSIVVDASASILIHQNNPGNIFHVVLC